MKVHRYVECIYRRDVLIVKNDLLRGDKVTLH